MINKAFAVAAVLAATATSGVLAAGTASAEPANVSRPNIHISAPPAILPPVCLPASQGNATYYWRYFKAQILRNKDGHGEASYFYDIGWVADTPFSFEREVGCTVWF